MRSGYKLLWTEHALDELKSTYEYLEANFSDKELKALSVDLDKVLNLIQQNPNLFPISKFNAVRRVVIKKFNTLYYYVKGDSIEILSFFSNRQSPDSRKIETHS